MADGFKVELDDRELQQLLDHALKATGDLSPAMKAIGEYMLLSTEENFAGEHAPDGTPWKPLKVLSYHLAWTVGRKKKTHTARGMLTKAFQSYLAGRKILTDSGELRGSIHYSADRTSVTIGSGKIYSAIHQFGGQAGRNRKVTIPARPYLGVGPGDRSEIVKTIDEYIARAL
mgnify:CR=1 FL=1